MYNIAVILPVDNRENNMNHKQEAGKDELLRFGNYPESSYRTVLKDHKYFLCNNQNLQQHSKLFDRCYFSQ